MNKCGHVKPVKHAVIHPHHSFSLTPIVLQSSGSYRTLIRPAPGLICFIFSFFTFFLSCTVYRALARCCCFMLVLKSHEV